MPLHDWAQILFFMALFVGLSPFLGRYIAAILQGERTFLEPIFGGIEKAIYRYSGVDYRQEMTWVNYAKSLLLFNCLGSAALFLLQLMQGYLPLNPQNFAAPSWELAFNIAISFATNTNWQSYAGETTLSYLTQMMGLTVQNFMSAAIGLCVLATFIRGITRKMQKTIGNFWVDLVRSTLYLLLPLSLILALLLVNEGVIQTFSPYVEVETLEKGKQVIPLGPVASQVAIKQIGTNGGGFFNANSAHPFENPTPLSNLFEMLAILLIPAASVYAYGVMIGSMQHARLLFTAMFILLAAGLVLSFYAEHMVDPLLAAHPFEGKETRFSNVNSLLWSNVTTATGNGSTNAMISSLSPLSGAVCLFNLMLGELIFGGVGVGLLSMLMIVLLTVFLAGLMIGRTPEYFGKKIGKKEIQCVIISVLTPGVLVLLGTGISVILPIALTSLGNQGPHGLTEILYAFSSSAANNGSSFAGLNANTNYFNLSLGVVMLIGRLSIIVPSLALAGLFAKQNITPPSKGTFSTNTLLFLILLLSVILIVGALTFFPALSLGPVAEQILMLQNKSF